MSDPQVARDVEALDGLDAVKTALQLLREATGLGTSLVARVTSDSWTACAVLGDGDFALKPGDQLELATTF
ncbi:MAG TPA: hypothetical protein VMW62_16440 [Chloroflexota bacterium]|nr:hypothetical protein [Chloroflexota bacterium]